MDVDQQAALLATTIYATARAAGEYYDGVASCAAAIAAALRQAEQEARADEREWWTRKWPVGRGWQGIPEGYVPIRAYVNTTTIVLSGEPAKVDDEETGHNCDAMGCGREHVLGLAPMVVVDGSGLNDYIAEGLRARAAQRATAPAGKP